MRHDTRKLETKSFVNRCCECSFKNMLTFFIFLKTNVFLNVIIILTTETS